MSFSNKEQRSSEVCNRVVVVSIRQFHAGVDLAARQGTKMDNLRLKRVMKYLGFAAEFHEDLTAKEIYSLFEAESRRTVDNCFMGIISTHGEEGVVFGEDGVHVRLSKIYRFFNSDEMATKTKLFLVQACRGHELDSGVEIETDSGSFSDEEDSVSDLSIPINTAVMYATAPGYSAYKKASGSVFIQTFCELLEEDGGRDLEIIRLMTRLNYQVAYHFQGSGGNLKGKKVMPCFATRLIHEVYPFRYEPLRTRRPSVK